MSGLAHEPGCSCRGERASAYRRGDTERARSPAPSLHFVRGAERLAGGGGAACGQILLDDAARAIATQNAAVLKKYTTWGITIEGHCDERGTAEYNLALGERRAVAVKTYLSSLGISADRIRTVSYGKEFPFDMGHNEDAWAKNRRGHFVITSK